MIYHGSCTGVCWLMHTGLGARQEAQTDALNAVGWDQPVQDLEALVAQRFFGPLDCGKKLLCEKKLNTVRAS